MATCSVVSVLCPNGRRQKVKVSPQMTLLQLIQEVCKKQNLNPNIHVIKHQRKTLDSTLTVRFANLPNNAHLELTELAEEQVHAVKKCVVALQLQSGDRLVHEFQSNQSLFTILEHWKTQSTGRISYNETADGIACIYANQEIKGLDKLKLTTLSMLGLNGGRGVIRVIQPTSSEKDETEVMEGVCEKDSAPGTKIETAPTTAAGAMSVASKLSTEEMDVSSRSASSVSMTSQTSQDDLTMQCSEITATEPQPIQDKSTITPRPKTPTKKSPKAGPKAGKTQVVSMDVEQIDVTRELGRTEPEVRVGQRSSDEPVVDNNQSVVIVEAFSGVGRTMSETGPEIKKARLHSPPIEDNTKIFKNPQAGTQSNNITQSGGDRETVVFRLGDGTQVSDDVSDDFFDVTVNDLRLMLKDLKNERKEETPLLTKSMREAKDKSKMEKYEKVIIRVYFPDRSVLQGFFSPTEKVQVLYDFVRENLQNKDTNFYLYTTPPRTVLDKLDVNLFQAKLFPAVIIHFGTREVQECYLSSNIMQETIDITEANNKISSRASTSSLPSSQDQPSSETTKTVTFEDTTVPSAGNSSAQQPTNPSNTDNKVEKNASKNIKPKWLKL